jgi:thioredoxin-like negative regulator of GroEL
MDFEREEAALLVEKYGIKGVPATMIVDEDGEPIKQVLGPIPESNLIELIKGEMS